jgi:hypothetical protein
MNRGVYNDDSSEISDTEMTVSPHRMFKCGQPRNITSGVSMKTMVKLRHVFDLLNDKYSKYHTPIENTFKS